MLQLVCLWFFSMIQIKSWYNRIVWPKGTNKAVNNADLLICIGTHLNVTHTSTRIDEFSKRSKKIIINIDKNEIINSSVKFDLKINADAKLF